MPCAPKVCCATPAYVMEFQTDAGSSWMVSASRRSVDWLVVLVILMAIVLSVQFVAWLEKDSLYPVDPINNPLIQSIMMCVYASTVCL